MMTVSRRFSLDRHDAKLLGVCSGLGRKFGIDPTFIRIGFVAAAIIISWKFALVAYAAAWIYLRVAKHSAEKRGNRSSEFDRMEEAGRGPTSIHALRTTLDTSDRRMMAIDHHLNRQNDELAREIEALRGDKR